jgi:CRP/FNR family transcriptional regulator
MTHGLELLQGSGQDISVRRRRSGLTERHSLADLLCLMGMDASQAPGADAHPLTVRQVHAGAPLFHEGQAAEAIYFVNVGMFKTFSTAEDGYEQVLGFCGRGEVLGFDAICGGTHPTAAVALEEARVYVLPLSDVFTLGTRVAALDHVLHVAASHQLAQVAEIADVMAAVAAEVRLARFLVQVSARMEASGQSPRRFLLRMCRRDIASHLGVAHETVSRSFGTLADWGYLRVNYREVEIRDLDALKVLARSTRGLVEEPAGRARRRIVAVPGGVRRASPDAIAEAA